MTFSEILILIIVSFFCILFLILVIAAINKGSKRSISVPVRFSSNDSSSYLGSSADNWWNNPIRDEIRRNHMEDSIRIQNEKMEASFKETFKRHT